MTGGRRKVKLGALWFLCLGGIWVLWLAACVQAEPRPTVAPTPKQSTPTPTLGIGSTMVSDKDGMMLVYVPAGNFLMGATDADRYAISYEKPQHTVYLDAFWIDQTDVTNAMFALFVQATGYYKTDAEKVGSAYAFTLAASSWSVVEGAKWQQPHGSPSGLEPKFCNE